MGNSGLLPSRNDVTPDTLEHFAKLSTEKNSKKQGLKKISEKTQQWEVLTFPLKIINRACCEQFH